MNRGENSLVVRVHEDRSLFREAVNFTTAETAFASRLIEKDYFCTVLLAYLVGATDDRLVFKGGTCLAKVHGDFYRLSEDLDFVVPMPVDAPRARRSKQAIPLKEAVEKLPKRLPEFRLVDPLKGANNSTQYIAVVGYPSLIRRQEETIKIEVGLREPLLTPVVKSPARTIMLDPVSGKPLVLPVSVRCISKTEAMAEKFRAALSRREAAIRDFFDIDYAVRRLNLHVRDAAFLKLIRHKLDIPGNDPVCWRHNKQPVGIGNLVSISNGIVGRDLPGTKPGCLKTLPPSRFGAETSASTAEPLTVNFFGRIRRFSMEKIYYSSFNSGLLKKVFVASTERGVCMVDFHKSEKAFLKRLKERFPGEMIKDNQRNRKVLNQLKKYLKGELQRFDCKLDFKGTPFQKKVWSALAKIPYGQTRAYKGIAKAIGHPKAFRAVGNANGQNSIPLIIPCHRVIESNGGLGGFGHGIKVKSRLLEFEKAHGIR